MREERLPGRRELDAPGRTLKEWSPHLRFETANRQTEPSRVHADLLGRPPEMPVLGYGEEVAELSEAKRHQGRVLLGARLTVYIFPRQSLSPA